MKTVVFLFALCAATAAANSIGQAFADVISPSMIGGVSVRRNEFPHLCAIELIFPVIPATIVGAGNILTRRWILTSATNVYANTLLQRVEVLCGRFDLSENSEVNEQRMRIARSVKHPRYRMGMESSHDIALIQLMAELHFTVNVQPIRLPVAATNPTGIATLIGWGGTNEAILLGQRLGLLQMTRVAILPPAVCNEFLAPFRLDVNTTHICTGPATGGMSPCNEDLGSSLTQIVAGSPVIVGVVSLTQACGAPGMVGTYTRVSEFVPWINELIL